MTTPSGDQTPKDTPLTVTPSPIDMPGARPATMPAVVNPAAPKLDYAEGDPKTPAPKADAPKTGEPKQEELTLEELQAKYKGVQQLARDFQKTAQEEHDDAERYRKLVQQVSGNGEGTPDPMAEIQRLRADVEAERTERLREEVARTKGVPPSQIQGKSREEMEASATSALEWAQGLVKQSSTPVVAPAANVTSNQSPSDNGVKQIQSRDELKGMSHKDILAAYNDGRMDYLMGKTPTAK